jgi:hypothetical protein
MLSVEGPIERFCRLGGELRSLWQDVPPTSVEQIISNSARTVMTPYGEQDGNGVDLSLIRANLERSVTDRIRSADQARRGVPADERPCPLRVAR